MQWMHNVLIVKHNHKKKKIHLHCDALFSLLYIRCVTVCSSFAYLNKIACGNE